MATADAIVCASLFAIHLCFMVNDYFKGVTTSSRLCGYHTDTHETPDCAVGDLQSGVSFATFVLGTLCLTIGCWIKSAATITLNGPSTRRKERLGDPVTKSTDDRLRGGAAILSYEIV